MTGVADDLFEADASQRKERASVPSVRVGGRLAEAIIWMIWSGGDEDHAHSSYVPPLLQYILTVTSTGAAGYFFSSLIGQSTQRDAAGSQQTA